MSKHPHTLSKPAWLKAPLPGGVRYKEVRAAVSNNHLSTVCREARCPNMGECWNSGTAAFMILGNVCTRGCRFCAVTTGKNGADVDAAEPKRLADAVRNMGLDYAVITSVSRDDLKDGGAQQFAKTIDAIRENNAHVLVEVLTPDYQGEPLKRIVEALPTVFAHNLEVVERLSPQLRNSRFEYGRSLKTLADVARLNSRIITKSSLMLGLGETEKEVLASMGQLREAGVQILVLGQYLQPSSKHVPVVEYISPAQFEAFARHGEAMGFDYVAAAPLARTSYHAAEAYVRSKHV